MRMSIVHPMNEHYLRKSKTMIKDTLCDLASIYGRVHCELSYGGFYQLSINDKPALLISDSSILTLCKSNCSDLYHFHGQDYQTHAIQTDLDYLLGLVAMSYKQSKTLGVCNAA